MLLHLIWSFYGKKFQLFSEGTLFNNVCNHIKSTLWDRVWVVFVILLDWNWLLGSNPCFMDRDKLCISGISERKLKGVDAVSWCFPCMSFLIRSILGLFPNIPRLYDSRCCWQEAKFICSRSWLYTGTFTQVCNDSTLMRLHWAQAYQNQTW